MHKVMNIIILSFVIILATNAYRKDDQYSIGL